MIKCNYINNYKYKLRSNKVEYSTAASTYKITHDLKVSFIMPYFSSRKTIIHCFNIENVRGGAGIGFGMIIGWYLMVKLCLKANFRRQILEWDETVIYIKAPGNLIDQPDLTKRDI